MEQNEMPLNEIFEEAEDMTSPKNNPEQNEGGGNGTPPTKFPKARYSDIKNIVAGLTGFTPDVVGRVLKCYYKTVEQLLLNEIEVPLNDIGTLTFQTVKPIPAGVRFNPYTKERVEQLARPGKLRVKFKQSREFKQRIYWATWFGEMPTAYDEVEWSNNYYGDKSVYKDITPEEIEMMEQKRLWKIATKGGMVEQDSR